MVLVTGGAGLLGTELIRQLLVQGVIVRAIYNKTPLPEFDSAAFQQVQCNILDPLGLEEAMQDVEQVYHCAAIVTFNPARKKELFKINIEGTTNVVNAALNTGVKKLVHVSSVAALGKLHNGETINETMNWSSQSGNSNYGESKYLSELEVWRGVGEGLEAVIVNPSIILGGGNWNGGSSKIFKSVYDEFPWYTEGVSGFVDVRDVARSMIDLMNSDISNERFIISAQNRSYRDVFNKIATAFGKRQPAKKVTPFIAGLVWRLEAFKTKFTGKDPLVTKETASSALETVNYDNSKLLQFLPAFNYRSIEDTIQYSCSAIQQKLNKV